MEDRLQNIEKEIALMKGRNTKVETDKAWERSRTRVFSILCLTYVIAALAMYFIGVKQYLIQALIPVLGYFLSTQSLPVIKSWWIRRYKK